MRLAIVGNNPQSSGSECIVFGHIGRLSRLFWPVSGDDGVSADGEISFCGDWDLRDMQFGAGAAQARALVGRRIGADDCRFTGRIVLVSHRWSGRIQIDDIGRKYAVDLYSDATRLVLVDMVDEIIVDVTALARADDGVLRLPKLNPETLVDHIRARGAWFAFLERDAGFTPSALRRGLEALRAPPSRDLKLRIVSSLLPEIAERTTAAGPSPPPPSEDTIALRDKLRLVSAAVAGLSRRVATEP